mgnify:FL=1|jgi:hypothetical protein|tara:strand:- start:62 stop:226 length:165 start_codon:yes stop_codon:yes gene_type:complete
MIDPNSESDNVEEETANEPTLEHLENCNSTTGDEMSKSDYMFMFSQMNWEDMDR